VLGKSSSLNEILWNFGRFPDSKGRLTLKQNPHFYAWLPTLPEQYGGKFRTDPIEDFLREKIIVLTDNPGPTGRVYLETAEKTRAFGNVWVPKNAIIFKGSSLSVISFSRCLTSFQTSVESWKVKVSSEKPFRTPSTYGTSKNLRHVLPLRRYLCEIYIVRHPPQQQYRQIPQEGYRYGTGENRFAKCCNPRTSISTYALRLNQLSSPVAATRLPLPQSHGCSPVTAMAACCR